MRKGLITASCGAALGAALLAPSSASAAVSCNLVADNLTVAPDLATASVTVDRSGAQIRAYDTAAGPGGNACPGTALVGDVEVITVNDVGTHNLTVLISLQGGLFEPGDETPPEATPRPEIEFSLAVLDGTDRLEIEGGGGVDVFDLGQDATDSPRVNLNPEGEGAAPDCDDISGTEIEEVVVHGRGGEDDLNASGCGIFAALDPNRLTIEGNNEKDFVRGGPGADSVLGGTQDDNVNGGAGDDSVSGGDQDDKLDGGTNADNVEGDDGTDRIFYDDRTVPVTATIGNGGADDGTTQDQGASGRDNIGTTVEHLTGGAAGDIVTGSSARNVLNGGLGDDVLAGEAGNDDLEGEGGNDTADGGDGNDEIRGGDGEDTGRGGKGSDDVFGGGSADKLFGGAGGDFLKGDAGKRDRLSGQAGIDKLNAKDRKKDKKISCGKGKAKKERAKVDKVDPRARSC